MKQFFRMSIIFIFFFFIGLLFARVVNANDEEEPVKDHDPPKIKSVKMNYDECYKKEAKDPCKKQEVTIYNPLYYGVIIYLNCSDIDELFEVELFPRVIQVFYATTNQNSKTCRIQTWRKKRSN